MENKCPVKGKIAYLVSRMLRAESAIFGSGCGSLGALEQHLPDIFVCSIEEPAESLVLGRVELPQIEVPSLTREDPAEEHDLDHVDKLDVLVLHILDAILESGKLCRFAPGQALPFPGGELHGGSGSELGGPLPSWHRAAG